MSDFSARRTATDRRAIGTGPVLLTLGGLAAAFGVASCCALPILLTTLGMETAWLGGIALLAAPHWSILLAAAALCFLGGAVLLWQQRRAAACTLGSICSRPAVRAVTMVGLLLGLVLLTLGYAYG